MSLYIDLTEFLQHPITTGIQRIEGELCKYLPWATAIPVRLHSGCYRALPEELIDVIGRYFRHATESGAAEIRRLGSAENGWAISIRANDTVLVPEIFDGQRAEFFQQLTERELQRYRFVVYDLLPATHPEFFPPPMAIWMGGYLQTIRRANHCGFISEYTREMYYERLKRTHAQDGVVLPLGCDSLGARVKHPPLYRPPIFSVLGTVEPRKNHKLIVEAFEPLLRQVEGLRLDFVGRMGWVDSEFAQRVRTLASDPDSGFKFVPARGDEAVRRHIEQSRATIYVSAAEGYGLPPVESLWLGTPVIASSAIPSLQGLGDAGIHYVEPLNPEDLRQAALAFLDDAYASRKTGETAILKLPTWQSFTQAVLEWCGER